MPVPPADPLLERPRPPRVRLQHRRAVIGLDHEHVELADSLPDMVGRMPEVREPAQASARGDQVALVPGMEYKANRIHRIVRDRHRLHLEVLELETRTRLED